MTNASEAPGLQHLSAYLQCSLTTCHAWLLNRSILLITAGCALSESMLISFHCFLQPEPRAYPPTAGSMTAKTSSAGCARGRIFPPLWPLKLFKPKEGGMKRKRMPR